jgi:hypothetical protein
MLVPSRVDTNFREISQQKITLVFREIFTLFREISRNKFNFVLISYFAK